MTDKSPRRSREALHSSVQDKNQYQHYEYLRANEQRDLDIPTAEVLQLRCQADLAKILTIHPYITGARCGLPFRLLVLFKLSACTAVLQSTSVVKVHLIFWSL